MTTQLNLYVFFYNADTSNFTWNSIWFCNRKYVIVSLAAFYVKTSPPQSRRRNRLRDFFKSCLKVNWLINSVINVYSSDVKEFRKKTYYKRGQKFNAIQN